MPLCNRLTTVVIIINFWACLTLSLEILTFFLLPFQSIHNLVSEGTIPKGSLFFSFSTQFLIYWKQCIIFAIALQEIKKKIIFIVYKIFLYFLKASTKNTTFLHKNKNTFY